MSDLYGPISSGASGFDPYSNKKFLKGTRDFLESNSLVAKIAFLIIVIFIFIILLRLGMSVLNSLYTHSNDPVLVKGTVEGNKLVVIPQDPNLPGSIPILRSANQSDGLAFTWSTWIWVQTPPINRNTGGHSNRYSHIFSKGNDQVTKHGMATPNNAPGLYLGPNYRDLVIVMNTFNKLNEEIIIPDIPIEKWVNVIIRCRQHRLDVFINGMLTKSHVLKDVPKQNYDNVYIGLDGGFAGQLSLLQYFAYDIGTNKIQDIVDKGPDLKLIGKDLTDIKPYYLSFRWFFPEKPNEVNL